jgi:hypothetical protein
VSSGGGPPRAGSGGAGDRRPRPPSPALKSLLLCDQIIQEAGTQKKSLIGVFHNIQAANFPATHPSLALYANLTDAAGSYTIEVRIVHLDTGNDLAKAVLPTLQWADRLAPAEICLQMQLLRFPVPGKYEVQLLANGELVGTRDFSVSQAARPPAPGAPPEPPPAGGFEPPEPWQSG